MPLAVPAKATSRPSAARGDLRQLPALEAVGTSVPGNRIPQSEMKRRAGEALSVLAPELLPYLSVFDNAAIDWRHLAKPIDWYLEPHGWGDRNGAFLEIGLELMERSASSALDAAGLERKDVDGIVFVTSTGIATPSLDARLVNRMGLRRDLFRVPVWGLGCAGGVAGLARASDLARAHPGKRFLLVSLELCSLAFMRGSLDKRMMVAATLFSDGCAAAVVAGNEVASDGALRVTATSSHQWPDTEWIMGWDVLDEGLGVVISPKIPEFVRQEAAPLTRAFLKAQEAEGARYLLHPGGAKVIRAYQEALELSPADLEDTAQTLRDYGNMSSPTVLYVLNRAMRRGFSGGARGVLGALGPGFASELALVEAPG